MYANSIEKGTGQSPESEYKMTNTETKNEILEGIAKNILRIETLETRNDDKLDFHEVSVWSLKEALELAYETGRKAAEVKA